METSSLVQRPNLPSELLEAIFLAGLPKRWDATDGKQIPWVVSKVSRHWRDAAFSSSRLWSSIAIKPRGKGPGSLQMVKECLLRSGTHPLDLRDFTLTGPNLGPDENARERLDLFRIIIGECERWQKFELNFSMWSSRNQASNLEYETLLSQVHGRLPLLEELSFSFPRPFDPRDAFSIAPRLSTLCILSVNSSDILRNEAREPFLPIQQVTSLRYRFGPPLHVILAALPRLLSCSADDRGFRIPAGQIVHTTHARLQSLSCESRHLVGLDLPQLKELDVEMEESSHFIYLVDFLKSTAFHLHSLQLRGHPSVPMVYITEFLEALQKHDDITTLDLMYAFCHIRGASLLHWSPFLEAFMQEDVPCGTILPRLSQLSFRTLGNDIKQWVEFIELRADLGLKEVRIHGKFSLAEVLRQRLAVLPVFIQSPGIDLHGT